MKARDVMAKRPLTPAIRAKLHHVRAKPGAVDLARFPDFFIAGPQRTGTTWLHANMRFHPEIFLSEPKEIFFFSRLKTPDSPKFQSRDLEWYLRFFHEQPALWLYKQAMCIARYGRAYRPKVRGEATASYAAVDRDVVTFGRSNATSPRSSWHSTPSRTPATSARSSGARRPPACTGSSCRPAEPRR